MVGYDDTETIDKYYELVDEKNVLEREICRLQSHRLFRMKICDSPKQRLERQILIAQLREAEARYQLAIIALESFMTRENWVETPFIFFQKYSIKPVEQL